MAKKPSKKTRKKPVSVVPPQMDRRSVLTPYKAATFEAKVDGPDGDPIVVLKTRRADLLGNMLARGQIAQYQFAAGERLQNAFEAFETNGLKSMDFAKPFVDGSGARGASLLSNRELRAADDIRKARSVIGRTGFNLMRRVLCERKTLEQVVKENGETSSIAHKHMGWFFRDCLNSLAEIYGLIVRGASPRPQHRVKHSRLLQKSSVGSETPTRNADRSQDLRKSERSETRRDLKSPGAAA